MNTIEEKFREFQDATKRTLNEVSPVARKNYLAIARMLIEKEQMPKDVLMELAHRIKPLMRPKEGSSLIEGLYWSKPHPLTQSFYYNFNDDAVVRDADDNIMLVSADELEEVSQFTCYHRYGGFYGFIRPGMDEVIQQFPAHLLKDEKAEYAVEIVFSSLNVHAIYDRVLDRHVSTVIVYRLKNGLPSELREQEVIYK